ncbi:hypothetical protein BGI40_08815 [Snodgrassella communis]|uniref:RHS repeat domain-containing protein n=1 Tax=Snodgrassella communis TaxID=2946699 RepID=UPI000C1E8F63|nr:RHS repeat-associated core domain-containing protein [Snodgrassella communis]PIT27971.1 hypothetical protein BGI38_05210 [Snodgrassella communis]PIT30334.1 hypothetical protein BGI39_00955 [Snodgrassella communis]PIT32375.1 hypothetical protein BGI40_08815 [Snodgrassella communis]
MRVAYGWKPDSDWGTSPLWQANLSEGQTLKNASYHYLISDHLGTPQLAINSTGEQSWKINSDAFGNSELDANNQITMNLRFPGQYYDTETGLSYNYFRDYDAKTGRYIQSDPIGLAGGINTYGYVGGNPLVYSDPTGEFAQVMVPVAVAAAFVVAACILTPACNKSLSNSQFGLYPNIGWLTTLPTVPTLSDNKIPDGGKCKTKDVEISDANIGGSPNFPNDNDPDDDPDDDVKSQQDKTLDDIIKDSTMGPKTKGSSTQYIRNKQGWEQAQKDFESLNPSNVQNVGRDGKIVIRGKLKDGRTVSIRPHSSGDRPTMEIRPTKGKRVKKIRY